MNARNPKGSKLSGGRSLRGAGQTSRGAYSCGLGWAVPRGAMSWICPQCQQPVYFAEKVSSLGKNWHRFCLKCERCHSILSPGGHAEHNGRPYCHKPCYGALFGPRGVNIGGVGYLYTSHKLSPVRSTSFNPSNFSPPRPRSGLPHAKKSPSYTKTFTGETSLCPGCGDPVYFEWKNYYFSPPPAEKVMSLGRNWHRPCLRCQRCRKTLTAGSHAEHDGVPYCHIPCYGYLFGPKGVNIGNVGCYIYDPVEIKSK
ncbi:cysteine-rich protein 3 isoform X4 [Nannospalax galili]|uniref:cysteine-rich protein 3 isoform X4 n=1 Tax=Nannospalax galili TaxID=1026970 RepID=UPI000819DB99|nr:cysteine-rich protein 3 isoform X4 [Nannospalax galili]